MPRFFVEGQPENGMLFLRGEDAHHAGRVLRLRPGEAVTLCDGRGTDHDCTVESVEKDAVACRVVSSHPADTEPHQRLTLCMALPKGDKMEFIVQKAVELGAAEIVPYLSKNCVSRPDKTDKKVERWRKIAVESAKQCGRGVLPDVALPLPNFGALCRSLEGYDLVLFCYELGGAPLRQLLADAKPANGQRLKIALITGAEGGFAVEEAEMAANAGVKTVGLGPRILRCETAPLAVLSAVMTLTGNLE